MLFFPTVDEDFQYFLANGYTGSINDMHYAALGDLGYTGTITDRTYGYLMATYGSYHEAMRDLRNGTSVFSLFSMSSLFESGEVGVLFDPSTTGTLYQTTAMTIPANPGDPVGMMLDQSQWGGAALASGTVAETLAPIVGPELLDPLFSTDGSGGVTVTIVDGAAHIVGPGSGTVARSSAFTTVAGKTYAVLLRIKGDAAYGALRVALRKVSALGSTFSEDRTISVTTSYTDVEFSLTSTSSAADSVIGLRFTGVETVDVQLVSVKEIPGYHATQATAAKRPIYGIHPFGGRRNLLTYSEAFDNAAWIKQAAVAVTPNSATSPIGDSTADTLSYPATAAEARQNLSLPDGTYTFSVYVKGTSGESVTFGMAATTGVVDQTLVFDGSWQQAVYTATVTGFLRVFIGTWGSTRPVSFSVWGAQVEESATATAYQKVTSQYVVTETGVPSVHYLAFDGVDDAMATPRIDFSATDKMSVFAGVRKLSDAALGAVVESSVSSFSNDGSFSIRAPQSASLPSYEFTSRGTLFANAAITSGFPAPLTSVLTGIGDISSDRARIRVDGTQVAVAVADQGTGNYGNYPLYIGARDQTSVYFNGNLYGLTVRGALSDATTIDRAETIVAAKTGITL
jgi:hypothetical protein